MSETKHCDAGQFDQQVMLPPLCRPDFTRCEQLLSVVHAEPSPSSLFAISCHHLFWFFAGTENEYERVRYYLQSTRDSINIYYIYILIIYYLYIDLSFVFILC